MHGCLDGSVVTSIASVAVVMGSNDAHGSLFSFFSFMVLCSFAYLHGTN